MNNRKELLLSCSCSGEVLKVEKYSDEEGYYLTMYKYYNVSDSLFRRIKNAIRILTNRELLTADVVLSKEEFNKIRKF